MAKSTTEKTLDLLRNEYRFQLVGIVERFCHNLKVPHGIRSDLFHIFDIIAVDRTAGIYGVQSCGADFAAHYRKITQEYKRNAEIWLHSGGRILLIGWRNLRPYRGAKTYKPYPRVKEIDLVDLCEAAGTVITEAS